MKILAALLSIATGLTLMLWWAGAGASWFVLDKVEKVTIVKDSFGDLTEKREWIEKFVPGLLDFAGPGAGACFALALVLGFLARKDLFDAPEIGGHSH